MKSLFAVLAALLTGWLFVPRDKVTTRVVGSNVATVPLSSQPTSVTVQARNSTLRLMLATPRMCQRNLIETLELTHSKRLGFFVPLENSGYALFIGIMLAPITLPVSAVVTGLILGTDKDTTTHKDRTTPNGVEPCPAPISGPIQLTLASGAVTHVVTGDDGVSLFELPADEPEHGAVVARTGTLQTRVIYYRSSGACDAHRLSMLEQTNAVTAGRARALQAIPRCASITTGTDPRRERAWELAMHAAIGAANGNCQPAFQHEVELKQLDPVLHTMVYGHREIVGCFGREDERRRQMSQCQVTRAEAMRAAQLIRDPNQRGEALRKIPRCV